jgi:hypothetical protein
MDMRFTNLILLLWQKMGTALRYKKAKLPVLILPYPLQKDSSGRIM